MNAHFFVDETKAKSYVVVAVQCPDPSLRAARRVINTLVLPRQRSVHMKHESASRRRWIADAVAGLHSVGIRAFIFDAGRGPEAEHVRRARALRAVVERASRADAATLVLDPDQTLMARDRRTIADARRDLGANSIAYRHASPATEALLAIPDVVAWCWARDAAWRRRIAPVIETVIQV